MRNNAEALLWAKHQTKNEPKYCLTFVWEAYGSPTPKVTRWGNATDAYEQSTHRIHKPFAELAAGTPVYLGASAKDNLGDVCLKADNQHVRASDVGAWGRVGTCTLAAREAMTGRKYVCGLGDILGNAIDFIDSRNVVETTLPILKFGSTGHEVKVVQTVLKAHYPLYASHLTIDGIYRGQTEAVVKEFQKRAGITDDGIVGPVTYKRLGITA